MNVKFTPPSRVRTENDMLFYDCIRVMAESLLYEIGISVRVHYCQK